MFHITKMYDQNINVKIEFKEDMQDMDDNNLIGPKCCQNSKARLLIEFLNVVVAKPCRGKCF